MKIKRKLTLGFVSVALPIGAAGYIALQASRTALQQAIGGSSASLAAEIMDKIDRFIYNRLEA